MFQFTGLCLEIEEQLEKLQNFIMSPIVMPILQGERAGSSDWFCPQRLQLDDRSFFQRCRFEL
jgi:hypothetical protein